MVLPTAASRCLPCALGAAALLCMLLAQGLVHGAGKRSGRQVSTRQSLWLRDSSSAGHYHRQPNADDTIFVAVSSYRDRHCAATLSDLFRQAHEPSKVRVGLVTYIVPDSSTQAERCEDGALAPYEPSIKRLALPHSEGKGCTTARLQASSFYAGETFFMNVSRTWHNVSQQCCTSCPL